MSVMSKLFSGNQSPIFNLVYSHQQAFRILNSVCPYAGQTKLKSKKTLLLYGGS